VYLSLAETTDKEWYQFKKQLYGLLGMLSVLFS